MKFSDKLKSFMQKVNELADAQETHAGTPLLVLDVETPNRNNDRISSISLTKMDGSKILWTRSYLVNPEVPFDPFNIRLTGIQPHEAHRAPAFPAIWQEIAPEFENTTLVAHNAYFDLTVLAKTCAAYQCSFPKTSYVDTVDVSQELLPTLSHHRLNDVAEKLNIPLQHHHAESDCIACAQILRWALKKPTFSPDEFIRTFYPDSVQPTGSRSRCSTKLSKKTNALNELQAILREAIADNKITEDEIYEIYNWLTTHEDLKGAFPFDTIYSSITDALADGILEPQELDKLLSVCQMLVDPLQHLPDCTCDDVNGKLVCLTGDFASGSVEEIEEKFTCRGAILKDKVVLNLDYLVVGSLGSAAWTNGNYGAKVKKALEYQFRGQPIKIVLEADAMSILND